MSVSDLAELKSRFVDWLVTRLAEPHTIYVGGGSYPKISLMYPHGGVRVVGRTLEGPVNGVLFYGHDLDALDVVVNQF